MSWQVRQWLGRKSEKQPAYDLARPVPGAVCRPAGQGAGEVKMLAHMGLHVKDKTPVSTRRSVNGRFAPAAKLLRPLYDALLGEILKCDYVQCDEAKATYEERRQKRELLARPVMKEIKAWMESEGVKYSGESLTGKAVTYAYNRWGNMMHYLEDGRIKIDNNLMENAICPIALGTQEPPVLRQPRRRPPRRNWYSCCRTSGSCSTTTTDYNTIYNNDDSDSGTTIVAVAFSGSVLL